MELHHKWYLGAIGVFLAIGGVASYYFIRTEQGAAETTKQTALTMQALGTLPNIVDKQLTGLRQDLKVQLTRAEKDANTRIGQGLTLTDDRTTQALQIVDDIQAKLLDPQGGLVAVAWQAEKDADKALNGKGGVVNSVNDLTTTYSALPAKFSGDRRVNGLIDESMGVLGATKIAMGQVAVDSKTLTAKWPSLLDSLNTGAESLAGIAANGKRETDKLLAPCLGPHPTAVSRFLARAGCAGKDIIEIGAPVSIGLARAGVL